MPTKAGLSRGQIHPPIEPDATIQPSAPAIPGIEVRYCHIREWRHLLRETEARTRLPIAQAQMRARKTKETE